ncbi:MAG: acetyl-CoA carboxylase carboxyltransferase subunit beta [Firmicutes bacterium]|nr:acetyl-CoA carboxylase carboxyltransferase subunit beta [Bacillota bacterium]
MLRVFRSKPKYATVRSTIPASQFDDEQTAVKKEIPDNLWIRCENCASVLYSKECSKAKGICSKCGYHFRISALERLNIIADENSFKPFPPLVAVNPLDFPGYEEKITNAQQTTKLDDAILIGEARIDGHLCVLGIIDFSFIGGSMGSVVGEQLTRGFEYGIQKQIPVVIFSGGGGGARMQEGIFSLMQMAKTAQAVGKFKQAGLLYISVLTHPTMGGVYASFASLGDIILAEPKALIGFAGPRIVEETTRQKLPEGFQTAEYALQNGMIDKIVNRNEMKETIAKLLSFHL